MCLAVVCAMRNRQVQRQYAVASHLVQIIVSWGVGRLIIGVTIPDKTVASRDFIGGIAGMIQRKVQRYHTVAPRSIDFEIRRLLGTLGIGHPVPLITVAGHCLEYSIRVVQNGKMECVDCRAIFFFIDISINTRGRIDLPVPSVALASIYRLRVTAVVQY